MKTSMKTVVTLLSVVCISGLVGCGNSSAASGNSSGEKLESTLNVIGGCEEPYLKAVCEAFGKKYSVKVNYQRLSAGEMSSKVETEDGNPTSDVLFGGTTDPYNYLKNKNLLEKYQSVNDGNITDSKFKDADHYWYGIYKGILGFMWNKAKMTELNLAAPTSWADLIDAKYRGTDNKGYITWSHPSTAGTAKLTVNTIVQLKANNKKVTYDNEGVQTTAYDDTEGMNYFKSLDKNIATYTKSGSGASKMVGPGECVVGIGFLHDVIYQIVDGKYGTEKIGMSTPSEGTAFEVGATALLKGAKNPNLGKKFIDFALTPECVELGAKNGSYQFLVLDSKTGVKQPQAAIDAGLTDVKLMNYDFDDAKINTTHYVTDWMTAVNKAAPTA